MGDLIDLAGAKVIHNQQIEDEITIKIRETLAEVGELNDQNAIKSLVLITFDHNNEIDTRCVRITNDDITIVGGLEYVKSNILASLLQRSAVEITE